MMLSGELLLHVWEHGHRRHAADRSLQLLAYALPHQQREALEAVDLTRRDWHLLQLRRQWFGSGLAGYADCPSCGERMEIAVDAGAIAGEYPDEAPVFISRNGRRFRFPTIGDLLAVSELDDADVAARQLLERCSLDESIAGRLPAIFDELDEVDNGLAAMAADRSVSLALACTNCGTASHHALEPVEYLWNEISAAATSLLDEVHLLASAYGWSEQHILEMSASRRRAYLSRIES